MCNVLPVILRANFDDPVDSAQDIVDRNLTLFMPPYSEMWKQWLATHSNPYYNKISETMIIPGVYYKYSDFLTDLEHNILRDNTHVHMVGYLTPQVKSLGSGDSGWWRSKERVEGLQGYGGFLTRKNWKHYEGDK